MIHTEIKVLQDLGIKIANLEIANSQLVAENQLLHEQLNAIKKEKEGE